MFDVGVILVGGAVTQLPAHRASGHSDAACVLPSPGQCSCRVASPLSYLKPLHWSRGQSERRNTPPLVTAGDAELSSPSCGERPVTVWDEETHAVHAPRQALGRGPEFHPERGGRRFPGREMEKHSRGDSTKGESAPARLGCAFLSLSNLIARSLNRCPAQQKAHQQQTLCPFRP